MAVFALALCAVVFIVSTSKTNGGVEELLEEQDSIHHVLPPHYQKTVQTCP